MGGDKALASREPVRRTRGIIFHSIKSSPREKRENNEKCELSFEGCGENASVSGGVCNLIGFLVSLRLYNDAAKLKRRKE